MNLSVIIPFHNEIKLISKAVESVLINTHRLESIEILICNDGEMTEKEIRDQLNLHANSVVRVLTNRYNKGPGGARNTGIEECAGDFIAFLDADDKWLTGKVDAQFFAIERGATFVATTYRIGVSEDEISPPKNINKPEDIFLLRGIGTSTVMITRALTSGIRFRDLRFAQDIDYWYALACNPVFQFQRIDDCYVEYSPEGSTKNKWVQLQYLYKVLRINNINYLIRFRVMTSYIISGMLNHYIRPFVSAIRQYFNSGIFGRKS